jgi:protein-disulfide isomerase
MIRAVVLSVLVGMLSACTQGEKEKAPPPPVAEMSMQEVIALEGKPGATPPLEDATDPAPPPLAGLEGAPGPSPAYGPMNAPVRVFVLSDFQCPVCRRVVEPMKYLARRYPTEVRIVFKQNALTSHRDAARAAAASIAAFRQGKFWAFSDRLFEQFGYDADSLVTHGQALGCDAERFKKDMADPTVAAQILYERALAAKAELVSTPGFIVNGITQMGWGSYMGLKSVVDKELARAKEIAAKGVPPARVAYEATRQSGPKGEDLAAALFPAMK